jgi:hypothetical protein
MASYLSGSHDAGHQQITLARAGLKAVFYYPRTFWFI